MIESEYVIIGGGTAGLAAAMTLLELGRSPLLIEAGTYPAHKVCGEFLSPSCLPLLSRWGVTPLPVTQMQLNSAAGTFSFPLKEPAGSLSHVTLDQQLAKSVSHLGATLMTKTRVVDLRPMKRLGGFHLISLSSGETIQAKQLIIATGRIPGYPHTSQPQYVGIKTHFSGINLHSTLSLFSLPRAYLGFVPVENSSVNAACLAKIDYYKEFSSASRFMKHLIDSSPQLEGLLAESTNLFEEWMEAAVPEFGWRSPPEWPQTYWIGDAFGTIPPASGNGLAFAFASGCLAAQFALLNQPEAYKRKIKRGYSIKFLMAKGLHHLFLTSSLCKYSSKICTLFPTLAPSIFSFTRIN